MPRRDPDTGKFVSGSGGPAGGYTDIEQVTATINFGMTADNHDGSLGNGLPNEGRFEGFEVVDYDDVIDRDERADLLYARHRLLAFTRENQAPPGIVNLGVELSSSPALQVARSVQNPQVIEGDIEPNAGVNVSSYEDLQEDSVDLVGPALTAATMNPHQDTGSSTGGGGAMSVDTVELEGFPDRIREFHPRDELFLNGFVESSGYDGDSYGTLTLQHWYGISER